MNMKAMMCNKSKTSLACVLTTVCLLLAACSGEQKGEQLTGHQEGMSQMAAHQTGQPASEIKQQMQRLQLLIVQAVSLATLTDDTSSRQAADLLRRAMSGPEMNAMHHGNDAHGGMMPDAMMQQTHDLGDAVFDLLETKPLNEVDMQWRDRLVLATIAADMRLDGVLLGASSGEFEAAQGRLLAERIVNKSASTPLPTSSPYARAASRLIPSLQLL